MVNQYLLTQSSLKWPLMLSLCEWHHRNLRVFDSSFSLHLPALSHGLYIYNLDFFFSLPGTQACYEGPLPVTIPTARTNPLSPLPRDLFVHAHC